MGRLDEFDIELTDDGDLKLDTFEKDFNVVSENDYISQQVKIRVKSVNPDWFFDDLGADMVQLLGMPNTKDTAQKGISLIRNCLTYDRFLTNDDVYIKPMPLDVDNVSFFLFIKTPFSDKPLSFEVAVALSAGINITEV